MRFLYRYNSLCTKLFNSFSCFQLADGTYVLSAAPDLQCWDNVEHHAMVGVSILGIVVYVLGIPAYVLATMLYAIPYSPALDVSAWMDTVEDMHR